MPPASDYLSSIEGLLPYQIEHAEGLLNDLRRNRRVLDASDTGIGKTYTTCALVRELDLPTLAVVPKSAIVTWERVGKVMGGEVTPINYEQLVRCDTPFGKFAPDERGYTRWFWNPAIKFLIFDEAHRCGGPTSFTAKFMIAAVQQDIMGIALSATAAENTGRMMALGYFLGLFKSPPPREVLVKTSVGIRRRLVPSRAVSEPFQKWAGKYGYYDGWKGWDFYGNSEDMAKVHRLIFPGRGRRLRKAEVPGFPETQITAELLNFDAPTMNTLYRKMAKEIQQLQEKFKDWNPECPASMALQERQTIDMLRVPVLVERAVNSIAEGNSHVIFVPYRATLEAAVSHLRSEGIEPSVIWGGQTIKERQENIDAFQVDDRRVCVIINHAGAETVSLHDVNGKYPRTSDIVPPWEAWLLKQMVGRVHRAGAKSKSVQRILCAAGTYEEDVYNRMIDKAMNLDAFNDGDLNPLNYVKI